MKIIAPSFFLILLIFSGNVAYSQVQKISYRGYTDCYKISNDSVTLIVVAQAGGRVFNYSLNGRNTIFEDQNLNGKTIVDFNTKTFEPDGGRFDVRGSVTMGRLHDTLWVGPYTTEITGRYSMKMTSLVDKTLGIDICREFFLDSSSSHLRIRQTMTNRSKKETNWYFWGRTFCPIDGKIVIPLNRSSKYSSKWGYYSGDSFINLNATDSLVQVSDTILSFLALKNGAKMRYAADPDDGWIVYGYNEQLFLMKYKVDLTRTYLTDTEETLIYYTDGAYKVELEPISPSFKLSPGQSGSFVEDWYLFSYPKAKTKDFNGSEAAAFALSIAGSGSSLGAYSERTGKGSINDPDNISVFPNPATDNATIRGKGISLAEIYSINGRMLYNQKFSGSEEVYLLNTSSIPDGVYCVKIFFSKGSAFVTRKMLKNNG